MGALQLGQIFLLQPTSNNTTVQSSNTLRHYTVTMPAIRRSLQPA
ncbi:hypothetical protein H9Q72_014488 [Fusarium xylarioides]|uniref:Uncharacterized protein n=1 Tax=Fusarium xylarioides TaxID=221167 RepID=A0A9P7HJN2_9HYPO|nr:hypothetical protein H9Q72_014488 [Fusarium xylarioides]